MQVNTLNKTLIGWLAGLSIGMLALSAPASASEVVDASKETKLLPGQQLEGSAYERWMRPFTLQRIGDGVYWLEVKGYSSTVVVGEREVMVIDAPRDGRAATMIEAIRSELTALPITTLVYSHYHYDHVGGGNAYADEAQRQGTRLRVVANQAAALQIERYGNKVPAPTQVIPVPFGRFEFDGRAVEMGTLPTGHSPDNSWILLKDQGVLHSVDVVHPGMLEFPGFTSVQDLLGYKEGLRELLTLDWTFLVAGHGDIGSRADVQLVLDYLDDVQAAVEASAQGVDLDDFVQEDEFFYSWFLDFGDAVATKAVDRLRPKWGDYPGFDVVAKSHATTLFWHLFTH